MFSGCPYIYIYLSMWHTTKEQTNRAILNKFGIKPMYLANIFRFFSFFVFMIKIKQEQSFPKNALTILIKLRKYWK